MVPEMMAMTSKTTPIPGVDIPETLVASTASKPTVVMDLDAGDAEFNHFNHTAVAGSVRSTSTQVEPFRGGIVSNRGNATVPTTRSVREPVPSSRYYKTMTTGEIGQVKAVYACSACGNRYIHRKSLNKHWNDKHRHPQTNRRAAFVQQPPVDWRARLDLTDPRSMFTDSQLPDMPYCCAIGHVTSDTPALYDIMAGQQFSVNSVFQLSPGGYHSGHSQLQNSLAFAGNESDVIGLDLSTRRQPFPTTVATAAHAQWVTSEYESRWDENGVLDLSMKSSMSFQFQPQNATDVTALDEPLDMSLASSSNRVGRQVYDTSPNSFPENVFVNLERYVDKFTETFSSTQRRYQRGAGLKYSGNVETNEPPSTFSESVFPPMRKDVPRVSYERKKYRKKLPQGSETTFGEVSGPRLSHRKPTTSKLPVLTGLSKVLSSKESIQFGAGRSKRRSDCTRELTGRVNAGIVDSNLIGYSHCSFKAASLPSYFRHTLAHHSNETAVATCSEEPQVSTGHHQQTETIPDDKEARSTKKANKYRFLESLGLRRSSENSRDWTTKKIVASRILPGSLALRTQRQQLFRNQRDSCFAAKLLPRTGNTVQKTLPHKFQYELPVKNDSPVAVTSSVPLHAERRVGIDTTNRVTRADVIPASGKSRGYLRLRQCRFCRYSTEYLALLRRHEAKHREDVADRCTECNNYTASSCHSVAHPVASVHGRLRQRKGNIDSCLNSREFTTGQQEAVGDPPTSKVDACLAKKGQRSTKVHLAISEPSIDLDSSPRQQFHNEMPAEQSEPQSELERQETPQNKPISAGTWHVLNAGRRRQLVFVWKRCVRCGFRTANRSTMARHYLGHPDDRRACTLCRHRSTSSRLLLRHIVKVHRVPDSSLPAGRPSRSLKYPCAECPFLAPSASRLANHVRFHGASGLHRCDCCSYAVHRVNLMLQHRRLHTTSVGAAAVAAAAAVEQGQRVQCNKCSFKTWNRANMTLHMRCHRTKLFTFNCTMGAV